MTRAQAHTLEGVVASLLLLSAMVFALEMTAVTPLTASTSSQHIENQQQASAEGLLSAAAETGALRRAILFWDDSEGTFHKTPAQDYYTSVAPPNEFGQMLNRTFGDNGIAYNVYVNYLSRGDQWQSQRMIYKGTPSDNAVQASYAITLTDDARLYGADGTKTATDVRDSSSFYAVDTASSSSVYNVVRVEVVVWRI